MVITVNNIYRGITPRGPVVLPGPASRIATVDPGGSAALIPVGHLYGEAIELRYDVAFTASQFQALFARVRATVANASTLRGAEFDARNGVGLNAGAIEGVFGSASVKGAGTIGAAFGVDGNLSMDADVAATITLGAALRGKVQAEDAATLTAVYGALVENESVTGGKAITAAYGARSSGAGATFTSLIDSSGAFLVVHDTDRVTLIRFKDAAGTTKTMSYDTSDNALVFA